MQEFSLSITAISKIVDRTCPTVASIFDFNVLASIHVSVIISIVSLQQPRNVPLFTNKTLFFSK